jgi:hypothetical protein
MMGTATLASLRDEGIRFPSDRRGAIEAAESLPLQSKTDMQNSQTSRERLVGILGARRREV